MTEETVRAQSRCQELSLGRIDEQRGSLCVAEAGRHVPFEIQRVYWIFDVPGEGQRANHAHREQTELLVAVRGGFTVHCDDGSVETVHRLDAPERGLLLPAMVFHHLDHFTPGALCLVFASGPYDAAEYVNDHQEFRELMASR